MVELLWTLEATARGMALACLALVALRATVTFRHLLAGRYFVLLALGLGAYVALPLLPGSPLLKIPVIAVAVTVPPVFWLFCDALFNENTSSRLHALRAALVLGFMALSLSSFLFLDGAPTSLTENLVFYTTYAVRLTFLALAVRALLQSRADDLVASRRSLRSVFLILTAGYIAVVLVVEFTLGNQVTPPILDGVNALSIAAVLLLFSGWFLVLAPADLFPPTDEAATSGVPATAGTSRLTHSQRGWLEQLNACVDGDKAYRRQDLSIRLLSEELRIPEHLLRKLINQQLGYRNFRQYLNHYRVSEVARRLADPAEERTPILTLALDAGFASITPFNRAFRLELGVTPSEYRASAHKAA